jgi:Ca2+-binding RTX toxin-like protein
MEPRLLLASNIPFKDMIANVSQSTGVFADDVQKGTYEGADLEASYGSLLKSYYDIDVTTRGFFIPTRAEAEDFVNKLASDFGFVGTIVEYDSDHVRATGSMPGLPITADLTITVIDPRNLWVNLVLSNGMGTLKGGVVHLGAIGNAGSAKMVGKYLEVRGTTGKDTIAISPNGSNVKVVINGNTSNFPASGVSRIDVFGDDGNDTITVSTLTIPTILSGGEGADYILGAAGADSIYGRWGNDTLGGGAGKNFLYGNDDDDRLSGSSGRDYLFGDAGNDRLYGNAGNDYLDGSGGIDRMFGGDGDDVMVGGSSNDYLYGEGGKDSLYGGKGNDRLEGGGGNDWLDGHSGNDTLYGQAGNDTLYAKDSVADQLFGDSGYDYAYRDSGVDLLNSIEQILA